MDNDAGNSPSSGPSPPAMIMAPPPPPPRPDGDCSGTGAGLENPSGVRNLKDILKLTTEMSANVPADENAAAGGTVDAEKMKFLTNALSAMSVNVQEEINNSINILLDPKKEVTDHINALDVLVEYVDSIDFANDFQKLGGFQVLEPCLRSEHLRVRIKTAELIATVLENNPYCQAKFIEKPNYVQLLMTLIEREQEALIRVKALQAISCLVRHNVDAFWKFIELGGDKLIIFSLKSSIQKLVIKATFLVCITCQMDKAITELYINIGVVEEICSIIMTLEHAIEHYHHDLFLTTLIQLFEMSPDRVKEICSTIDYFKDGLLNLKSSYPNDVEYEELKEQMGSLVTALEL